MAMTTSLDDWYAQGHLSRAQHDALRQWQDDGGGIRKRGRPPKGEKRQEPRERDLMQDAAQDRHRKAWRAVERAGDNVARAVHRLVMLDDPEQRVELVQRGASVLWAFYRCQ